MSIRRFLTVIALAVASLCLDVRPASAEVITWPDMEARLSDCDIVQAKIERNKVNLGQIELVVESGPRVFSWKGVGVYAASGGYYEIGTGKGPRDSMLMTAYEVMGAKSILLGKAKFAGLHTGLYEIEDLKPLKGGDRVTFTWVQDYCPDLSGWIDPKSLPDWVLPGSTTKVTIPVTPFFTWYPDQLLAIHFDPALGIPAYKIDKVSSRSDKPQITVELTAPNTAGTTIYFNAWVNQLGGDSETLIRKSIRVLNMAPQPIPDPPPKLVTVPDVRGMSLAQGRKTLASVGLGIAPQGRDPSVPESDQTIYAQMPGMGSVVLTDVKINVSLGMQSYVTPAGFSELVITNCDRNTYHLWEYVNDQWQPREDIPPMWGDGSICPADINQLVHHALTDGTWQFYAVVDPTRCKEGNDPHYSACWAANFWIKGDANGTAAPLNL